MTGIERLVDIVNDGPYSGGMIHISVHKLREICDQIEGEADVETVKSEAMAALNFVEEHGGLEKARRELERVETWHLDKLEMYRLCTKYGGVKRLKRHLMPEGLEWPIYDTGEPVGFGDEFLNARGGASVLRTVLIKDCRDSLGGDFYWKIGKGKNAVTMKNGEPVKRPAPKVLDGKNNVTVRDGKGTGWFVDADNLTHEQLDNWDRLFEDEEKSPCEYFGHAVKPCLSEPRCLALDAPTCKDAKISDMFRRVRNLRERGQ